MTARLITDIESAPIDDANDYIEDGTPPANYGDEAAAKWISKKRKEDLGKCALDPDLARVVAIGWLREGGDLYTGVVGHGLSEEYLLKDFWEEASGSELIGFHVSQFDMPMLHRRSFYLGVSTPRVELGRYRHPNIVDLAQMLTYDWMKPMHSLHFYAKRLGFEHDDTMSGKDIPKAFAEGRYDDIEKHVRTDVELTAKLAQRMGCFQIAPATVPDFEPSFA